MTSSTRPASPYAACAARSGCSLSSSTLPRRRTWRRSWSGGQTCSARCEIWTSWPSGQPPCWRSGRLRGYSATWPSPAITAPRRAALPEALPAELILGPVASTIQTDLAVQRKQAMDAMLEALDSELYRKLIGLIHHWRADPPFTAAADASPESIDSAVKKAKKKARKRLTAAVAARRADEPSNELFHRARKASKRHRYAAEAALPVWGAKADKIISQRKDLQDLLGNHQDSIVSAAFLRELGGRLGIRSG